MIYLIPSRTGGAHTHTLIYTNSATEITSGSVIFTRSFQASFAVKGQNKYTIARRSFNTNCPRREPATR